MIFVSICYVLTVLIAPASSPTLLSLHVHVYHQERNVIYMYIMINKDILTDSLTSQREEMELFNF